MAVETGGNLNNPAGRNQYDRYSPEIPYGDVKRMTELTRESPISGAPLSGRALNTPQRARGAAARAASAGPQRAPSQGAGAAPLSSAPAPLPPDPALLAEAHAHAWASQLLTVPGISPLVQQYAQQVARQQ